MTIALKIKALEYHRNGVSGVGFVVARFTFRQGRRTVKAIATVFNSTEGDGDQFDGYCAVLTEGDIREHWRGDHFEQQLRSFIKSDQGKVMMFPLIYPNIAAVQAERARLEAAA